VAYTKKSSPSGLVVGFSRIKKAHKIDAMKINRANVFARIFNHLKRPRDSTVINFTIRRNLRNEIIYRMPITRDNASGKISIPNSKFSFSPPNAYNKGKITAKPTARTSISKSNASLAFVIVNLNGTPYVMHIALMEMLAIPALNAAKIVVIPTIDTTKLFAIVVSMPCMTIIPSPPVNQYTKDTNIKNELAQANIRKTPRSADLSSSYVSITK